MTDPIVADLTKMRELLAPRGAWTQYSSARKRNRQRTHFSDKEATCYCLGGALNFMVSQRSHYGQTVRNNDPRLLLLGFETLGDLWNWNDRKSRRKAEVLKRIDEAIQRVSFSSTFDKRPPSRLDRKRRHWNDIQVVAMAGMPKGSRLPKDEVYMMWGPVDGSRNRGRYATIHEARMWCSRWVRDGIEPPTVEEHNVHQDSLNWEFKQ